MNASQLPAGADAVRASRGFRRALRARGVSLAACITMLAACGGGEGTATFIVPLQSFNEEASFLTAQRKLTMAGIHVLEYRCGFMDGVNLPFHLQSAWVEGRTPRVTYFTVTPGDAERASTLGIVGFTFLTPAWTNANSEPFDCGPLPTEG